MNSRMELVLSLELLLLVFVGCASCMSEVVVPRGGGGGGDDDGNIEMSIFAKNVTEIISNITSGDEAVEGKRIPDANTTEVLAKIDLGNDDGNGTLLGDTVTESGISENTTEGYSLTNGTRSTAGKNHSAAAFGRDTETDGEMAMTNSTVAESIGLNETRNFQNYSTEEPPARRTIVPELVGERFVNDSSSSADGNDVTDPSGAAGLNNETAAAAVEIPNYVDLMNNNIRFSLDLYKTLAKNDGDGNVFFSPLSIFTTLLMVYRGSRGHTADELERVLNLRSLSSKNPDLIHRLYGEMTRSVETSHSAAGGNNHVSMANKMFVSDVFEVKQSYQDDLRSFYDASVERVDFTDPRITFMINAWVAKKTRNRIPDLFPRALSPSTSCVLLNALFFEGDWQYRFDETSTVDDVPFRVDSETTVNVSMMVNKVKLAYGESRELGARVLELPYRGDRLAMFVVVPSDRRRSADLESLERRLNVENFKQMLRTMRRRIVNVRIPRFTLRDRPQIVDSLMRLGLRRLFGSDGNLTGIADDGMYVSAMQHEATIEVTETGSVAAAATGVILERLGSSFERHFDVDRPFIFFVVDKQNGMILFVGRLKNPSL